MTKTSEFSWRQEEARALMNKFRDFWSQNPGQYGITGGTDAGSGERNARNLYNTMVNHGSVSRKTEGVTNLFFGAGAVWEDLEDLVEDNLILEDEVKDFDRLQKRLDRIENSDRDPRNIIFNTVISYDKESGEAERGKVRGHFLTQAYWDFRQAKAKDTGNPYNVDRPDPEWTNKDKNKAKPPLWRIIFGRKNSLRTLIDDIKKLTGPTPPPIAHLDVKINRGKIGQLANITEVQEAVRSVLQMPSIYPAGKSRAPIKSKLNDAMAEQVISTNPEIMRLVGPDATVLVENEGRIIRRGLDEFPDYEKINSITLNFPRNNIILNRLIREVLGDDIKEFERPNRVEDGPLGLVLKADEEELIREASSILKNVKFNLRDSDRADDDFPSNDPDIFGYTREDGEEKIRVNLDNILITSIREETLEDFNMFLRLVRGQAQPGEAKRFADNVDERAYNQLISTLKHESIHLAQIYGEQNEETKVRQPYIDLAQAVLIQPLTDDIEEEDITHLLMEYFKGYAYNFIYMELPAYWAEGDKTWGEAKEHIKYVFTLEGKFMETLNRLNNLYAEEYDAPRFTPDFLDSLKARFDILFSEIVDSLGDSNAS